MVTSLVLVQKPFVMVHLRITESPGKRPVIVEVGEVGDVTVAVPVIRDQEPVPSVGALAKSVAVFILQRYWFGPAMAVVGSESTLTITSSIEAGQVALMVHRKV